MDTALVRVPAIVAKQCRESIDYVVACIDALIIFRASLVDFHKRIARRNLTEDTEFNVTELRSGISDITDIIVTFDEFIDKGGVRGDASIKAKRNG
jgi:deoxyadenosine/deoxycytidine kinase